MNQTIQDNATDQSGKLVDEIIRMSDFNYERLPMLDIVGERMVESLSGVLGDLTRTLCEASLQQLDYVPMAQVVEALPETAVFGIAAGHPFEGEVLVAVDFPLVVASTELMLGANPKRIEAEAARDFTAIEQGFGEKLSVAIVNELQRSFSTVVPTELDLSRVELDPESVGIAKLSSLCVRMRYSVAMAGQAGVVEIVVPYDALEPIRPDLGKIYFGDRGDTLNTWKKQLHSQIERATAELEIVLSENLVPIQSIMGWKPGSIVEIAAEEDQIATVKVAGTPMFKCELGKRNNGFAAVQITETLESDEKESRNDRNDN